MPAASELDIDGRKVRVTNLPKVLYPGCGFTKAQVIDYYACIADVLLHFFDRTIVYEWDNMVYDQWRSTVFGVYYPLYNTDETFGTTYNDQIQRRWAYEVRLTSQGESARVSSAESSCIPPLGSERGSHEPVKSSSQP